MTDEFKNPNGCRIKSTWFATVDYTVPDLAKKYVDGGHELACHTVHHTADPDIDEIFDCRRRFEGLFNKDGNRSVVVSGFRTPDLLYTPRTFEALSQVGFLYDSTLVEQAGSPFSPNPSSKVRFMLP